MSDTRRRLSLSLAAGLLSFGLLGHAQDRFPTKPVKIIVPYPVGQSADVVLRILADELTKIWGQSVFIENRGGGASIPGTVAGKDAPADGYTLVVGSVGSVAVNPALYPKLPYDPLKDFQMVNAVYLVPAVILANPTSPIKTLKDLVQESKKNPGKLNWGYAGMAGLHHVSGEKFKMAAGIDITPVFYQGSAPMDTDLLAGHIPLAVDSLSPVLQHIRSGKLNALAVTTTKRLPELPDVPTIAELGYPGYESVGWAGLMAPAATPRAVVEKISADVRKALALPVVQERVVANGAVVDARGTVEWTAFVTAEVAAMRDVVKKADIKVQ